jgi:hypothetical protein
MKRFWAKVDKDGPFQPALGSRCWIWRAALTRGGYGVFRDSDKLWRAHRFAYYLAYGSVPDEVDHRCRNRICVNPRHLRAASRSQNNQNQTGAYRNSTSGMRGVVRVWNGKWGARVIHRRQAYWLGSFDTPEEAAEVARLKRLELFTHNDVDRDQSA